MQSRPVRSGPHLLKQRLRRKIRENLERRQRWVARDNRRKSRHAMSSWHRRMHLTLQARFYIQMVARSSMLEFGISEYLSKLRPKEEDL
jgi:hypothetical protein